MPKVIPQYDNYDLIGRVRMDANVALANSNPLLIARGLIYGTSQVNKFGENPLITAGTTEDVWDGGGTYSFPTSASITHVRQATNQVGTDGGANIEVQGLDTDWALTVQMVALDATDTTTEVALTTPLRRVFRMKVNDSIVAAADIWCGATGMDANSTSAIMQAGNNQTLMAIYTVPAGKTAFMTQYYANNTPTSSRQPDSVEFSLWMADRASGYEFQLKHRRGIPIQGDGFEHQFNPYLKINEKTDIKISAAVDGGVGDDGSVHAGFDLILIDD